MERFFQRTLFLCIYGVVMSLIPWRIADLRQYPAQDLRVVIAVVKIDRVKMKAEIAQLRQEHHATFGTFASQEGKLIQHVLF